MTKACLFSTLTLAVSAFHLPLNPRIIPKFIKLSSTATCIDISDSAIRDIPSFHEWATAYGVQTAEGFELATMSEDPALDVGVMTNADMPKDTTVLYVPSEMILSANAAQQEVAGLTNEAEELFAKLGTTESLPRFYLFLKLLREYEAGDSSPWFPWLNSLPRYFSNGAAMTHFCCQETLPPLVGKLVSQERTTFKQFFKALDFCEFLHPHTRWDKKLAKWAYSVVYTRGFDDGFGDVRITPMADMFNHDTYYQIQGQYDEQGNFYAFTTCDVPAGSTLSVSYTDGDSSNPSFVFSRYGFLDYSSPATFCKIMIPNPSPELINIGYDHSKMLFYKDTGDVSQEVWDVLLYQILEQDPSQQEAFYNAHIIGDYETKQAYHDQYSGETFAALMNHVDVFLEELDVLTEQMMGRDLSVYPRLPLIREHNDFVREIFLNVKANLLGC